MFDYNQPKANWVSTLTPDPPSKLFKLHHTITYFQPYLCQYGYVEDKDSFKKHSHMLSHLKTRTISIQWVDKPSNHIFRLSHLFSFLQSFQIRIQIRSIQCLAILFLIYRFFPRFSFSSLYYICWKKQVICSIEFPIVWILQNLVS